MTKSPPSDPIPTPAVILAGGQARRFGSDKAIAVVQGRSLLSHVLDALRPQADPVLLNGPARAGFELSILDDAPEGQGPLAGILAALRWAKHNGHGRVLTVPIDVPFLPKDLVAKLAAVPSDHVSVARSGARAHHVIALWPTDLEPQLTTALEKDSGLAVHAFQGHCDVQHVAWPVTPRDPFFNINSVEDQHAAEGSDLP